MQGNVCALKLADTEGVGMGIFRTTIVLAGGLLMMPSPPEDAGAQSGAAEAQAIDASYLVAASSFVSDLTSICDRQPAACQTAGLLAARLERNAKYSVKLLYEWANRPDDSAPKARTAVVFEADPLTTGSTEPQAAATQSTLKIDDLLPPWIGPAPKKG
jgi:hypothetical protein